MKGLVEYCAECSHTEDESTTEEEKHLCTKTNKEIPVNMYEEGLIPNWCPLPKTE